MIFIKPPQKLTTNHSTPTCQMTLQVSISGLPLMRSEISSPFSAVIGISLLDGTVELVS
jgi:hypothetical protein